ncbi:ribosome small subunit-dependent GTPase A [Gracilinema caldarium]|uniref:Small ribosomal subunit biogenesis GTPase RsgA n=1 Tax=Gracilinema caldarium (strain ATCC 51460 / DSM 7334 / H1) TaxID=744872 RepID=F8F0W6_GRAC1|nr:ribosome small subunit-dependent GTPase A [Gracilinema caldarium]AEJ20252.1 ribosome biogenesis GTPase RsgA [Gracilinema caldarium DSM 7334]
MLNNYSPEAWGWKGVFYPLWQSACREDARNYIPGRIIGTEFHQYDVVIPHYIDEHTSSAASSLAGIHEHVRVSGSFIYRTLDSAGYPVTGDWVLLDPEEDALRIHRILDRQTCLSRGAAGEKTEEQVLVANIDTLLLVFALDGGRNFLRTFLERALVVARSADCGVCIVLNKADLADEAARENALSIAVSTAPASPVVLVSAKTCEGIETLKQFFSPGETLGVLGKSGVGKSALIRALGASPVWQTENMVPDEQLKFAVEPQEGEVREQDRKGRHTTTSSRLYRLDSGLLMIDSPGIRELKLWGDQDDLNTSFRDIAELALQCHFSDCTHSSEPGCAVQGALAEGTLDEGRYRSYLQLQREQAWLDRRLDDQAQRAEKARWKQIAKFQKTLQKNRR